MTRAEEFERLIQGFEEAACVFDEAPNQRNDLQREEALDALRAFALREPEGEVYEVANLDCGACCADPAYVKAGILLPYVLGTQVRVTRVEEEDT